MLYFNTQCILSKQNGAIYIIFLSEYNILLVCFHGRTSQIDDNVEFDLCENKFYISAL